MSPRTAEPTLSPAEGLREAIRSIPSEGNVVEDLFNRAYALREVKTVVLEMRVAVRESLRNLETAGVLSDAHSLELFELFPPRERKGKDDEIPEDEIPEDDDSENDSE